MKEQLAMQDVFRFDAPGTLPRPGPIGRLVRLGMGLLCGWWVWRLGWHSDAGDFALPAYWFWFLFALVLAPYVVNIGFGVKWGAWPRILTVLVVAGAATAGYLQDGSLLGQPLWVSMTVTMLYVYGHLALSFVLSALLATPGCEMRTIPHLISTLGAKDAAEHYCPGFIDAVDRWERERRSPQARGDKKPVERRDLIGSAGGLLLVYGLPYLGIILAGNFGGPVLVTAVWTLGFTVMGVACLLNARRCRRVHCYFTGPWFLLAAAATVLLRAGLVDFGPSSWSTLVNTALFGAPLLFCVTEGAWGRYWGSHRTTAS